MASSTETGEERLTDTDFWTGDMDPFKALCFLSEGEQNRWLKRRCIASAVNVNGNYRLLTSSSAIKDEDKKKNLILKRFSRRHFGRYTVEACFFKEFGEFTFLKIKGTPQVNGGNWDIRPLYLKEPSSENLKVLTSSCATENFKFEFKCDREKGTIELISKRPVEETSIVGAPIIIEQSGRFSVIGVVGLTSEKQLCPCYLNKSILAESSPSASPNKQEPRKQRSAREESTGSQSLQFPLGKNQSEEDDLGSTLGSYKKNHPIFYFLILQSSEIIWSLRNVLVRGQLATKEALTKADSLFNISTLHSQPSGAIVADFLVDVDVPELLTEVLRSLYQKYPNFFSSEKQSNSEVKWALKVINSISKAILNFCDLHDNFCEACGKAGVVEECWELLRGLKTCTHDLCDRWIILEDPDGTDDQFSTIGVLGRRVLGILHNLLKSLKTNEYFKSCGAVETLLSFYQSQFPKYRMRALLCLAYLVDEKNNYLIMATEDFSEPIKDLLKLLEGASKSENGRCQGFSATEIAQGLSYVARNDSNKRMIGQLGGIPLLAAMLENQTDLLGGLAAVKTLYMLSLDEQNKAIIKANDKKGLLKRLYNSSDEGIQETASGVIREIEGKKEHNSKSSDSEEHIFISYQRDYQKTLLLVKTELESKGFQVWMDVNERTGNIPQRITRAMEKSSVVLIAMSRKYQSSKSCSSDSEEHIFISYQRDYQKTMLLVKTELESKGFQVWMDVNESTGNIPQRIARAIEKSSVVLIAMSRKYQSSKSCSSEATYAYKLGKQIIPLMMEENYKPDGWLEFILATKLYMHFEKDPQEGIQQLLKEITNVTAADMC